MILIAIGTKFVIDGRNYIINNFSIEKDKSEIKEYWIIMGILGTKPNPFYKEKKEFRKIIINHRYENERLFIKK